MATTTEAFAIAVQYLYAGDVLRRRAGLPRHS